MRLVIPFATDETPELAQVGGKARSLGSVDISTVCSARNAGSFTRLRREIPKCQHGLVSMTLHGLRVPPGFVLTVDFIRPWVDHIQKTPEWIRVLNSSPQDLERNCEAVKALCWDLEFDTMRQEALDKAVASLDVNVRRSFASAFDERVLLYKQDSNSLKSRMKNLSCQAKSWSREQPTRDGHLCFSMPRGLSSK